MGQPPILTFWPPLEKTSRLGGKTKKKSAKKILRLHDTHKMYILQKIWTKTVNPALSSDDQQRNPNMNNRDHLVGQLTIPVPNLDLNQTPPHIIILS